MKAIKRAVLSMHEWKDIMKDFDIGGGHFLMDMMDFSTLLQERDDLFVLEMLNEDLANFVTIYEQVNKIKNKQREDWWKFEKKLKKKKFIAERVVLTVKEAKHLNLNVVE